MARHVAPKPSPDFAARVLERWNREDDLVPVGSVPATRSSWRSLIGWGGLLAAMTLVATWIAVQMITAVDEPPMASTVSARTRSERSAPPAPSHLPPRVVTGAIGTAGFAPAAVLETLPHPSPSRRIDAFDDLRPEELGWR